MKPLQDDPTLTAYMLGELPQKEALAVEHAIAGDPALRLTLSEAERTKSQLEELLGGSREELLPRQRDHIRRAAREAGRKGSIEYLGSHHKTRHRLAVPLALAAVFIAGIFILIKIPLIKSGAGVDVSSNTDHRDPQEATPHQSSTGSIRLPLRAGNESLAKIISALRVRGRMPSSDEVSIPELLNAFPLQTSGSVATQDGCMLGTEIIPCPWKPSGILILVEVRAAKRGDRSISVEYHTDENAVITYNLFGYPEISREGDGISGYRMAANSTMLLLISVETKSNAAGKLTWSVDGETAPSISLLQDREKEPSDDARFAALIGGFGMWLLGKEAAYIDETILLGMAREVAADDMAADRYDFLDLVNQAVRIAGN